MDSKSSDLSRRVKARSTYGAIIEAVELQHKRRAALHADPSNILALEDKSSSGGAEAEGGGGEVALYGGAGGSGSMGKGAIPTSGLGSQVAHLGSAAQERANSTGMAIIAILFTFFLVEHSLIWLDHYLL